MALSLQQKNKLIDGNKREFADRYDRLFFPDTATLDAAARKRQSLLYDVASCVSCGCRGTKLDMTDLSPGCKLCVAGRWSCLFVNGKCNGSCFYCPTSQNEIGLPTTNTVSFSDPREYVAYLDLFGFQGASISGGEPLVTLERSLEFIRAIKRHFGQKMYVWLYTNGILASEDVMKSLADAGLDEIRFDIGATGYSLRQLEHAVGVVPTVTVEIPSVPEASERMKNLLPTLSNCGVQHLNLHQLRLTPHNFEQLVARKYRFLHGTSVTVLDSELSALELILHGKKNKIPLPINYCSYVYSTRFQGLAARRRNAAFIIKSYESLTENGFIRELILTGNRDALARQLHILEEKSCDKALWHQAGPEKLSIHSDLLSCIDFQDLSLLVSYSAAYQRQAAGYHNPFCKVPITDRMSIVVERETLPHRFSLTPAQALLFQPTILPSDAAATAPSSGQQLERIKLPEEIQDFEYIREGLAEYY